MTEDKPQYFKKDRIVRDRSGRPIGRVVLSMDPKIGARIPIAILEVPKALFSSFVGVIFYIDEIPYKVPDDLTTAKFSQTINKMMINNFYLERVEENSKK